MYKIIDNFFEDPLKVRKDALSLKFSKLNGIYPGYRAWVNKEVKEKIALMLTSYTSIQEVDDDLLKCFYQISPAYYGSGWIHRDDNCRFAGVVYLNENTDRDAGTSIYEKPSNISETALRELQKHKANFYNNKTSNRNDHIRNFHNSNYKKIYSVDNVFNRLFLYKASLLHCENKFFGNTKETCRLTLVFFYHKETDN